MSRARPVQALSPLCASLLARARARPSRKHGPPPLPPSSKPINTHTHKNPNRSAQILLVVLPTRQTQLYREIKQATDSLLGVSSQCVVAGKAGVGRGAQVRGRMQYAANVALKINAKMGGINVKVRIGTVVAFAIAAVPC